MEHAEQIKWLFVILYNIVQLVRYSDQRPQTSDDVAYFSIADPFDNIDYQYDENPKSSEQGNQEVMLPDFWKRDIESETNISEVKPSEVKQIRKKRNSETDSLILGKQSTTKEEQISLSNSNRILQKRSNNNDIAPMKQSSSKTFKKKRSYRNTRRTDLINGDERFPNHIIKIRSADPKNDAQNDNPQIYSPVGSNKNPFGHSIIPTLNIEEFNKRTEINASLLSPDKTSIKLPIEDVLSLIRTKRSTYEEEMDESTERGQGGEVFSIVNKEEISDLDVAESSIIFKPLFRYRSQIGQRRRVYNYN